MKNNKTLFSSRIREFFRIFSTQLGAKAFLGATILLGKTLSCPADETQKKDILLDAKKQAQLLPQSVWIPVPDISDRTFWESKRQTPFAKRVIVAADRALQIPAEQPPEEYYHDYLRNGNRTRYQQIYFDFCRRYENLAMALCFTGDTEKYLKHFRAYNDILCAMPTWVLPAHDKQLENLKRICHHIDLCSSNMGATVAIFRKMLSPILNESEKENMFLAVRRQVITPYVEMAQKKRPHIWFISTVSNWNAVCNANTMLALLASETTAQERLDAATLLLASIRNYYNGFTPDGYCTEGISYWKYGFGHYLKLAATLRSATNGKLDIMNIPIIRKVADLPERLMLSRGIYPAFADCGFSVTTSPGDLCLRNHLLNYPTHSPDQIASGLHNQLLLWSLPPAQTSSDGQMLPEKITAFPSGGVFIFRHPDKNGLNFVCKGGNNGELHNHNDVGTFSVTTGSNLPVLGDLGGTIYTRDTFTNKRYQNKLLASYGHPVPLIDGIEQSYGEKNKAKLLKFEKNDNGATVVFDIRKAYPELSGVKKLERRFQYEFAALGKASITDTAVFAEIRSFETALMTFGKLTSLPDGRLQIKYGKASIDITVDTNGIPWTLKHETLQDCNSPWKDLPQRWAICLDGKHKKIKLTLTITPSE